MLCKSRHTNIIFCFKQLCTVLLNSFTYWLCFMYGIYNKITWATKCQWTTLRSPVISVLYSVKGLKLYSRLHRHRYTKEWSNYHPIFQIQNQCAPLKQLRYASLLPPHQFHQDLCSWITSYTKQYLSLPGLPEILHLNRTGCPSFIVWSLSGCMTVGAWSVGLLAGILVGARLDGACTTHSASHLASPAELMATHSYCPPSSGTVSIISSVNVLSSSNIL